MKTKTLLILLGVAGILMVAPIAIAIAIAGHYLGGQLNKPTGQLPVNVGNACVTPLLPTITDAAGFATALNQYIQKTAPNSPFNNLGADFVAAGQNNGINPAWEVAMAQKEETLGTASTSLDSEANNSFGLTATSSQPNININGRLWYKFDSFDASIPIEAAYLQRVYIAEGLTTFDAIINKYAPPSENNTAQYVQDIENWVGQMMTLASQNGSVMCGGANTTNGQSPSNPTVPNGVS